MGRNCGRQAIQINGQMVLRRCLQENADLLVREIHTPMDHITRNNTLSFTIFGWGTLNESVLFSFCLERSLSIGTLGQKNQGSRGHWGFAANG